MYNHYNIFRDRNPLGELFKPAIIIFILVVVMECIEIFNRSTDLTKTINHGLITFITGVGFLLSLGTACHYIKNSHVVSKTMAQIHLAELLFLLRINLFILVGLIPYIIFQLIQSHPIPLLVSLPTGMILCTVIFIVSMYSVQHTIYDRIIILSNCKREGLLLDRMILIRKSQFAIFFCSCILLCGAHFFSIKYTDNLYTMLQLLAGIFALLCLGILLRLEIPSWVLANRQADFVKFSIYITSFGFWLSCIHLLLTVKSTYFAYVFVPISFLTATLFMLAYYTVLRSIEAVKLNKKGYEE